MRYLSDTLSPPQSEPIPGSKQIENSAGGYVWQVDPWTRLRRFLILGSEGGSYYTSERKLTVENVTCLAECVKEDGERVVREVVEISEAGRAAKNDPAIFALAWCASADDAKTRAAALDALPQVCRIGTHLFTFASFVDQMRGWGRGLRKAVAAWYTDKEAEKLAYQLIKYRQRAGWSHRDLLRKTHPRATGSHNAMFGFVTDKDYSVYEMPAMIEGYLKAQRAESPVQTAKLVRDYGLPREALQTDHLASVEVWDALLESMPVGAMVRNLGNMTKLGLLTPTSDAMAEVVQRLGDQERLRKARIHPIQVLAALTTYAQGHGSRGGGEWTSVPQVVDALDAAFHMAFGNVEPTNKRVMLALDVSGSMNWGEISGVPGLTPRIGSAAMAMITARTEPRYELMAFSDQLIGLMLTAGAHLNQVVSELSRLPFGGTDCSLPMLFAAQEKREVDLFVIYTDSETWAGRIHPAKALQDYRKASGIDAKLCVVGMVANDFTIADPDDAGMLDVVGFDTATPRAITEFSKGF